MATFRLGPIGFPYSTTPGAVPEPELINVAGIAINVKDQILYSKDDEGNMFTIGSSYDGILEAHFSAIDPHGTFNVVNTDGDVTLSGFAVYHVVKRIGSGTGTVTLDMEDIAQNAIVKIDNVWDTAGEVNVVSSVGGTVFHLDATTEDASVSLTGKGQFELLVDVENNKVYLTNIEQ
ncbi:MAG: hypothetical protein CMF37_14900 [Leeuwenhoekiella sp.]|nr:hypothetical protein [Leeuwenhoekiella sp.]MBQ50097.1 hypothetical protein [Leeuwenhoekiella sp.]MBQ50294.1 hypothetical protein [Leeuwenhoekiella sp.]MBQ50491.1 hypothetical protein [Leeuwenhoekiella sp.]|tara:strand:+ start:7938 stop:8468 length:531 start_codon:yes stop_codon:yes gene_type:complete